MSFPKDGSSYIILSPIELSIRRKIEAVGKPLKGWDVKIYRGVLTGCNEAFIITTEKRNELLAQCQSEEERQRTAELIRPILRGRDIKRYSYDWAGLWIIATFPSRHYDIEDYPAVRDYLLHFGKERLEQTGKTYTIDGETFKSRKKTANKWFEVQDSIAYWKDFDRPKIIYPDICQGRPFVIEKEGYYIGNTAYFISSPDPGLLEYLVKTLNSDIMHWYYRTLSTQLGQKAMRMYSIHVLEIPIPPVSTVDLDDVIQLTPREIAFMKSELYNYESKV